MSDWRHAIARRLEGLHLPPTREAEVVEELSRHLDDRYRELRSAGALATYLPAHRANAIDPMAVLKRE